MSKIKVSVIVPVFNVEEYLSTSLDSILNQTLKDIEIICINDGSTDASLDILENYAKKDARIKIISKKNEGQGIARNIGLDNAQGEFIAFVDSDDFIKEDMLEKSYEKSVSKNLDLVMYKISSFDNETHEINDNLWYYSLKCFDGFEKEIFNNSDTKKFTHLISVTPFNKLYKRSFIEKNNIRFPDKYIFEDEVFFYNVYLKAKRISLIDENLYYYRTNRKGSTVSNNSDKDYTDVVHIFRLIRQLLIETNYLNTYKKQVYNRFFHLILWRFSQTAPKYRENFFNLMKREFSELLEDKSKETYLSVTDLESKIKSRTLKVLNSKNLDEFEKLDSHKHFSVIMALYNNEKYLEDAIESLITQNFGFEHNIELIIVDDGSSDDSLKIAEEYQEKYLYNIQVLSKENGGQASARNLGLEYAKGDYINFIDSDDKISPNTFSSVYDFAMENPDVDVISIPMTFFDNQKGRHLLNYKYNEEKVVDLLEEPDFPQLSASSAFVKKEAIGDLRFNTELVNSEDALFINKILLNNPELGLVKNANYLYRKRFDESSTIDNSIKKRGFFIDRLKYYFKELIDSSIKKYGKLLEFIQYTLVYDLQWMVKVENIDDILDKEEINEFWESFLDVLSYFDEEIILNYKHLDANVRGFLFSIKKSNLTSKTINNLENTGRLDNNKFYINIVNIKNNVLYISGLLMSTLYPENIEIVANCGNNEFKSKRFIYPSRKPLKFLSIKYKFPFDFDLEIPISKIKDKKLTINALTNDECFNLPIVFEKYARLSTSSNYMIKDNHILIFKHNSFYLMPYSFIKMLRFEYHCLMKICRDKGPYFTSALAFRLVYIILYPFLRNKKIWLFMDRRDSADDNAEQLFKYASSRDDNIKKYFTVLQDSKDYGRLTSRYENVLPFYSIKQRVIYLFADKIISSHPDENILNPFYGKNGDLYSGFITSEKYFLQHGVTKDNISRWLRKFDKDLSLIVTVSDMERQSFLVKDYNYSPEIIQTLGFPRFDKLESKNLKKQILIMPSWRENIQKNEFVLKNSKYFKGLNNLLNNEELIDYAKDKGYKIIFKPHPNLFKFIDLFDLDENIIVDDEKTYHELFNESELLITDYSSVAFDFAYLKKPVIYYQYSDDYNFDLSESYFDYESMGFGEVIKGENELIILIKDYLANNCKMKDVYTKRVDDFYKFTDKNNCKRVYEWIYEN